MFAVLMLLILPLSLALSTPRGNAQPVPALSSSPFKQAITEAFGHRSYVLLVLGFFTCGFQLAFITVHLPAYLVDRGLDAADRRLDHRRRSALFNIVGSLGVGWLSSRMPKRYILSFIYFARALAIVAFITLPASNLSAILFGAFTGLMWLSTVPPTNGLVR